MVMDWTAIVVLAINSAVQGAATVLSVRYVSRIAERLEPKNGKNESKGGEKVG